MNHWLRALGSFAFLLFVLMLAYQQTQAPAARTDSDLDYAAITSHVATIAARPHPMGSVAQREVRDYIVQHFEGLGLQTEVQKTTVVYRHPFNDSGPTIIGNVENIIARLPGTGTGNGDALDLVLMAHYDSRADGPGAGDDASGAAAIMETARVMAAGTAPRHDVVFLITDGEEMGLLGAQGFFRQHPAAAKAGLILDFEARGSYGVSSMFETSEGNSWLIDNLIASAPNLNAGSLTYEVYKRMPNDTDMSISRGEGIPGLNFAFISGLHDYHSMGDSATNLNPDSLAQQANYALATARHFANLGRWPDPAEMQAAGNKTYFNLRNGQLVSYSERVAVATGVVVLVFGLWIFVGALRSQQVSWRGLGQGVLALMALLVLVGSLFASLIEHQQGVEAGVAHLVALGEWPFFIYLTVTLGMVIWFGSALKRGMKTAEAVVPVLLILSLSLLSGGSGLVGVLLLLVMMPLLWWLGKRPTRPALWSATLLIWWLLTARVLFSVPNAAYVFVWPLFAVLLAVMLQRKPVFTSGGISTVLLNMLAAVVPLMLLVPVLVLVYLALGTALPQGVMVFSVLVLLLVWPLLRDIGRPAKGVLALICIGAGLTLIAVVILDQGFDTRHQRGEELFFAIDVDRQKGFWVTPDARPGSWLGKFMGENPEQVNLNWILPAYDQSVDVREAALPDFQAATLSVVDDQLIDGSREIRLHLQSPAGAEYINLLFSMDAGISAATVNGFDVELPGVQRQAAAAVEKTDAMKEADNKSSSDWWRWRWYGLPASGAEVVLALQPATPLSLRIVEVDWGTPEGMPQRPGNSMPKSYRWSDSTVIFQTVILDGQTEQ